MGYTHYFPQLKAFTPEQWNNIVKASQDLLHGNVAGYGGEGSPVLNSDEIGFNGKDDSGHEDFQITREHNPKYNFCKTRGTYYDAYVVAVLCLCHRLAPGVLDITSDGDASEWQEGLLILERCLGDSVCLPEKVTE